MPRLLRAFCFPSRAALPRASDSRRQLNPTQRGSGEKWDDKIWPPPGSVSNTAKSRGNPSGPRLATNRGAHGAAAVGLTVTAREAFTPLIHIFAAGLALPS